MSTYRLQVDPIACAGHGVCAEEFPERVTLDEWGYPMVSGRPIDGSSLHAARKAASLCPVLALHLQRTGQ